MGILRTALLKGSQSPWLERQVTRRRFAARAVRRFLPGEDAAAALTAAARLSESRIGTVLTRLGENVTNLEDVEEVTLHYLELLRRIDQQSLPTHLSIKLTQLGLDISHDACETQVGLLAARAAELGNFVWIDMEGSAYTDATLAVYRRVRSRHANVGVCLQAYLVRTPRDLEALAPLSPVIRLVKGAYREPPDLAFPRKRDVDDRYFELAERLLESAWSADGAVPGIATHDTRLLGRIRDHAAARGIGPDAYEFQLLYGIAREEQLRLAAAGHRVRVLVSYGSAWFPWYMRRLAERPANLWFVAKSVVSR